MINTAQADEIVPKRTEFSRYQAMLDHSPFAIATAAALPAATPSFAKDIYIANAARSPDGDLVTLNSASDKNFKEYLTTKGPNEHGYGIANIEWSEQIGATKVTVSKEGQFATVTFNQALLSSSPGGGQPSGFIAPPPQPQPALVYPQQQHPSIPAQAGKPTMPGVPIPPPRTRGVIPRNPSVNAPPIPNAVATPPLPPNNPVDE
ncbi:MAG TPA: hypothetical protein VGM62_14215 [Chthoniobacterales bacterium]